MAPTIAIVLCDLTRKCYLLYLKVLMPFYITCCYLLGAVWHYLRGTGITSSIEHLLGRSITSALVLRGIDKGFNQNRTVSVSLLPIIDNLFADDG